MATSIFGCVDSSPPSVAPSGEEGPPPALIDTDPVPESLRSVPSAGPYDWQNVVIKGGGFVTGIVFSTAAANLIYARTDVGGAYRWNHTGKRWVPLLDWVTHTQSNWMGVESIAADPDDPARVYLALGTYLTAGNGIVVRSNDFGNSWTRHAISAPMGGNVDGRSMGERLAIDPNRTERLYFASRSTGLWSSADSAESWQRVPSFPATGDANLGLSFVAFDRSSGAPGQATPTAYVGVATVSGPSLYRTRDAGETWEAVPGPPANLMPHHGVLAADGMLYLAFNSGPGPNGITSGGIFQLDTRRERWSEITPSGCRGCGYGGVSVDASRPGTLLVSTIDVWSPDRIYRSTDAGKTWSDVGARAERDTNGAEWLYFGSNTLSATGWMGDIEIDPWNPTRALYVTGQGIWWSDDVVSGSNPTFRFACDGLEETVPLDLASPPEGASLISGLGDIAGFRHDDVAASPAPGMFENPRFDNTNSLDFAEEAPELVVRVGTAGSGLRRGAYSKDGGTSWTPFESEPEGSQGSGSVAISSDGNTVVWAPRGTTPHWSDDLGAGWTACSGLTANSRIVADRVDPDLFYAVSGSDVLVSDDAGRTFTPTFTGAPRGGRLRSVFANRGEVWLHGPDGLYRSTDAATGFERVPDVTSALAIAFGRAAPGSEYPTLFVSGIVAGEPGLFRSEDAGETWTAIHDEAHHFGYINQLAADRNLVGRVYLGTGGRGILYGDPR